MQFPPLIIEINKYFHIVTLFVKPLRNFLIPRILQCSQSKPLELNNKIPKILPIPILGKLNPPLGKLNLSRTTWILGDMLFVALSLSLSLSLPPPPLYKAKCSLIIFGLSKLHLKELFCQVHSCSRNRSNVGKFKLDVINAIIRNSRQINTMFEINKDKNIKSSSKIQAPNPPTRDRAIFFFF